MGADGERDPQLLPSIGNARVNAVLADSLRALRAHTSDTALRGRIDDVLAGRASLQKLARDESFAAAVAPLAEHGWRQWESMPAQDRGALASDARQHFDQAD